MSPLGSLRRAMRAAGVLTLGLHLIVLGVPASAGTVSVEAYLDAAERRANIERVRDFLAEERVRSQLESLGVDPAHASERVAALTDEELAQLDARMDDMPAGGDVIAILGVAFVVMLILELLGVTNVFTAI